MAMEESGAQLGNQSRISSPLIQTSVALRKFKILEQERDGNMPIGAHGVFRPLQRQLR